MKKKERRHRKIKKVLVSKKSDEISADFWKSEEKRENSR